VGEVLTLGEEPTEVAVAADGVTAWGRLDDGGAAGDRGPVTDEAATGTGDQQTTSR
jgi:hypothetical protein